MCHVERGRGRDPRRTELSLSKREQQIVHGFAQPNDVFDGWVDAFTIGKKINTSSGQASSTITYDFQQP